MFIKKNTTDCLFFKEIIADPWGGLDHKMGHYAGDKSILIASTRNNSAYFHILKSHHKVADAMIKPVKPHVIWKLNPDIIFSCHLTSSIACIDRTSRLDKHYFAFILSNGLMFLFFWNDEHFTWF